MLETPLQELFDQAIIATRVTRNYDLARELYETILVNTRGAAGREPEAHRIRMQTWERLGDLLNRLGLQQQALAHYATYQSEAQSDYEKSHALSLLGRQLCNMGRLVESLQLLQQALLLSTDLDISMQAPVHFSLGNSLYESGHLEEALGHFSTALAGFVKLDDREQQLRVRNWEGMTYARLGKIDRAIKAFQDGLRLARQVGDRATSILLNHLGEAHRNLFDTEQALIYHEEGMRLAESTRLASNMADLARNLGADLIYLGKLDEGLAYLYRALTLSEESGRTAVKLQTLYALSLAEGKLGNLEMAKTHAQVLLELAREKSARAYEAEALYALGLCYKLREDTEKALQLWQQASFLAHETEQRMVLWQIHAAMAEAVTGPELPGVHRRIAAEVITQITQDISDKKLREKFLAAPQVKAVLAANAS